MYLITLLTAKTGNDVGQYFFISMSEVRRPVDIVDGGRDVEKLHGGIKSNTPPPFVEDFDAVRYPKINERLAQ